MATDDSFPKGILFRTPHPGAPSFIKGNLSFKVDEAVAWLQAHAFEGWVNIDIKKSKDGKFYLQINDWRVKKANAEMDTTKKPEVPPSPVDRNDSPF